jgi:hypothetical protein
VEVGWGGVVFATMEQASPHKVSICLLIEALVCGSLGNQDLDLVGGVRRSMGLLIAKEIEDVDKAREKGLDELCGSVRASLGPDKGARAAECVEAAIHGIRCPDDLMDMITRLHLLTFKPSLAEAASGRRGWLDPESLFGRYFCSVLHDCRSMSFSRLSFLFDQILAYCADEDHRPLGFTAGLDLGSSASVHGHMATVGLSAIAPHSLADLTAIPFTPAKRSSHIRFSPFSGSGQSVDMDMTMEESPVPHTPSTGAKLKASVLDASAASSISARAESSLFGPFKGPHGNPVDASVLSARQVQMYLQDLALRLQADQSGRTDLAAIGAEIRSYLDIHPDLPRAHFVLYLASLHHRDRHAAEDSLHRYFDFGMRSGGPNPKPGSAASAKQNIQHAALNLASMHFRLGHLELAASIFDEAIRMAQFNKDHACVAQALGWLYHVLVAQGENSMAVEVLERCSKQASSLSLHALAVYAHLSRARAASCAPSTSSSLDTGSRSVWTHIDRAYGEVKASPGSSRVDPEILQVAPSINRGRLLVCASALASYGYPVASLCEASAVMGIYSDGIFAEDAAQAASVLAHAALCGLHIPGYTDDQDECVYVTALRVAEKFWQEYPYFSRHCPTQLTLQLLCEWQTRRGELCAAEETLGLLCGMIPSGSSFNKLNAGAAAEAHILTAEVAMRRMRWGEAECAARAAEEICQGVSGGQLAPYLAKSLLMRAEVSLRSGVEVAIALELIMKSIAVADAYNLDGLRVCALLSLSRALLALEQADEALIQLRCCMPHILQHGEMANRGIAWLTLARAHLCCSTTPRKGLVDELLLRAEQAMHAVHDMLGLKEVLYLRAHLSHVEGDKARRDAVSRAFLSVSKFIIEAECIAGLGMSVDVAALHGFSVRASSSVPWNPVDASAM